MVNALPQNVAIVALHVYLSLIQLLLDGRSHVRIKPHLAGSMGSFLMSRRLASLENQLPSIPTILSAAHT